jgi:hypothetical protein
MEMSSSFEKLELFGFKPFPALDESVRRSIYVLGRLTFGSKPND